MLCVHLQDTLGYNIVQTPGSSQGWFQLPDVSCFVLCRFWSALPKLMRCSGSVPTGRPTAAMAGYVWVCRRIAHGATCFPSRAKIAQYCCVKLNNVGRCGVCVLMALLAVYPLSFEHLRVLNRRWSRHATLRLQSRPARLASVGGQASDESRRLRMFIRFDKNPNLLTAPH